MEEDGGQISIGAPTIKMIMGEVKVKVNVPSISQFYAPVNMAHLEVVDTCLRKLLFFGAGSVGRLDMAHRNPLDIKQQ